MSTTSDIPLINSYRVIKVREKQWWVQRYDGANWWHTRTFSTQRDALSWKDNVETAPINSLSSTDSSVQTQEG